MGGSWALMVAGRHPGLVSRVMVIDMMPYMAAMFGGPGVTPDMRPQYGRPDAHRDARRAGRGPPAPGWSGPSTTMVRTEALRPRLVEQSLASDNAVSTQALYDLLVTDLRPDVANIRVPMEVLWAHSPNAPVAAEQLTEYFRASYAGAPQAVVTRIPDSYHFIMFDQPEAFQRELRTFLEAR